MRVLVPGSVVAILQLGYVFGEASVFFALVCILIPMLSWGAPSVCC